MFFNDVHHIQSHLNIDWSVLLKNIKNREDQHLDVLQYNKKILNQKRDEETSLFINDEIIKHKEFYNKIEQLHNEMDLQQKQILQKYQGTNVNFIEIIKLMGRVGARVLETFQTSLDKIKIFDQDTIQLHKQMKDHLIKLLNAKNYIDLEEITTLIIAYTKNKLVIELQRLKRLIKSLEGEEFDKLYSVYKNNGEKKHPPPLIINHLKDKIQAEILKEKSPLTGKSPLKEELKKHEKTKKMKQKMATKLTTLYSTMDISKPQLFEQIITMNTKQRYNKLYNEIFSRNKFNYEQIVQFESKKELFAEKVRLFKEEMERESKKIKQVMIKRPLPKEDSSVLFIQNPKNKKEKLDEIKQQKQEPRNPENNEDEKITMPRYKIRSPSPKVMKESVMRSTQQNFNHLRFDATNQQIFPRSNRARLPQIGLNHGSSFDIKIQHSVKHKIIREEKHSHRTNIQMKNIQVGVEGVIKKSEKDINQNKIKKKNQPNPIQYTFYVRRSINKFYQPKHNILY